MIDVIDAAVVLLASDGDLFLRQIRMIWFLSLHLLASTSTLFPCDERV
jgi:hypothetical protein